MFNFGNEVGDDINYLWIKFSIGIVNFVSLWEGLYRGRLSREGDIFVNIIWVFWFSIIEVWIFKGFEYLVIWVRKFFFLFFRVKLS